MFSLKQTVLLALVGTAFAVPVAHRHRDDYDGPYGRIPGAQGWVIPVDGSQFDPTQTSSGGTVIVTIYPDSGNFGSGSSGTPDSGSGSGSSGSPVSSSSGSGSTGTPTTGDSGSGSSGSGSDTGYMAVVNKWRVAMGHSALTQDSKLEANAQKTVNDGNGQMVHELNSGTMGQVLAPGSPSDFEKCYVGGWLCEMPNAAGLDGICASMSAGWSYDGQTGHAKILNNDGYSKIGCANNDGIWGCDLA